MRLAIADPPYPPQISERYDTADGAPRITVRSRARRWYGDSADRGGVAAADFHPDAGDWDDPARHRALLEQLVDEYDGWAIATTPDGIQHYGPLPVPARIMVWHKPRSMPTGRRIASTWEPVIVLPPRDRRARTGSGYVPDLLSCAPPGAGFAGAKPGQWTRWVLDALGYVDGDTVDDLFPGSGAVSNEIAQGVLL